ncbi:histidine phosphotransferase [Thelephora ganbajun]|uniref:Histidine phosphotransferase n=1 Tax=Thelephora ganbajun TaxID=370292 RepID=A0ACB6ZHD9_THEGA|nr:histidine phosphotransferase [Thelephora ganbajun]
METFEQILELDEDSESYDFAWEMASAYMDQAETTFEEMEEAIAKGECKKLSSLGHFLKGSSATLGVTKVQNSCELIQHYGDLRDIKTGKILTSDVALSKISAVLKEAKEQYKEAEIWLRKWYSEAKAQGRITEENEDD